MKRRPLSDAIALDPKYYVGDQAHDYDQRSIIASGWQVLAPASSVKNPGDCITRDIAAIPVVIVRTGANELKGYLNICQHRAGPVATSDGQGLKNLRCAYHGWTYNLDGELMRAPEMRTAENFDKKCIHLTPISVVEWNNMIFARIGDGLSFEETFEGIDDMIKDVDLSVIAHHTALRFDVRANWKVYVDNYLEGYHLPYVHPGLTQLVEYPDYTTELGKWWSVQRSPVPEDTGPYAAGEAFYFFVYPNTMLNIMPGRVQTNRVIATGADSCVVEFDFYYAPGCEDRAKEDIHFSDIVQEEDRTICEHVQRALVSGAYSPGRLSPTMEAGVWHWQNILRDVYEAAQERP